MKYSPRFIRDREDLFDFCGRREACTLSDKRLRFQLAERAGGVRQEVQVLRAP